MMKKKLLLADHDSEYLREISYYFMEYVPQFELVLFTKEDTLLQYLQREEPGDVLVLDEQFADEKTASLGRTMTRIALSAESTPPKGFFAIKKYQKMSDLASQILIHYAEDHDTLEIVQGSNNTQLLAFYSPAGGSGKTTMALGTAVASARMGMRCFYLNLEEIDSIKGFLEPTAGSLSDLFLALNTKGMNAGIRLKASVRREPSAGFDYLSGVESIGEYGEIREENVRDLLKMIRNLADYDLVVIDLSSGFGSLARAALEEADRIVVPFPVRENQAAKLSRFLAESSLHDRYDTLFQKMSLLLNAAVSFAGGTSFPGRAEEIPEEIGSRLSLCGYIGMYSALADWRRLLREGDQLISCMGPVLQLVRKDS